MLFAVTQVKTGLLRDKVSNILSNCKKDRLRAYFCTKNIVTLSPFVFNNINSFLGDASFIAALP